MKTPPDPPPSIERHSRKCAICTHPDRQAIDEAFLHRSRRDRTRGWARVWADDSAQQNVDSAQRNIVQIVKAYNLPSLSSLYRHAHATGLRVRAVNRLCDCEATDSARQEHDQPNSNRENEASPAEQIQTPPHSNRESNRENKPPFSQPAQIVLNAEIQRMLIGK